MSEIFLGYINPHTERQVVHSHDMPHGVQIARDLYAMEHKDCIRVYGTQPDTARTRPDADMVALSLPRSMVQWAAGAVKAGRIPRELVDIGFSETLRLLQLVAEAATVPAIPAAPDTVQITLERRTAQVVRNALMTYRAVFENVVADMGSHDHDKRADHLRRISEAKLATEEAIDTRQ